MAASPVVDLGHGVLMFPASSDHSRRVPTLLLDRPESTPGEKDRHEIADLLRQEGDATEVVSVLRGASERSPRGLADLMSEAFRYLLDLGLDRRIRTSLREIADEWQRTLTDMAGDHPPAVEVEQDRALNTAGADRASCPLAEREPPAAPGFRAPVPLACAFHPRHRGNHRSRT